MTKIPVAQGLEPWKVKIVQGAMVQAEVIPGILHTTFAERIRALSVVGADLTEARRSLETLRAELLIAVNDSFQQAFDLAGEWWA